VINYLLVLLVFYPSNNRFMLVKRDSILLLIFFTYTFHINLVLEHG